MSKTRLDPDVARAINEIVDADDGHLVRLIVEIVIEVMREPCVDVSPIIGKAPPLRREKFSQLAQTIRRIEIARGNQ